MKKRRNRVVADSNIYISALHAGGYPQEVLNFAQADIIELFVSESMLQEVRGVLKEKMRWPTHELQKALKSIKQFTQLVQSNEIIQHIKDDPDDDRILECAVAANADYIISGDKHLLSLKHFRSIEIVSPRSFLERH